MLCGYGHEESVAVRDADGRADAAAGSAVTPLADSFCGVAGHAFSSLCSWRGDSRSVGKLDSKDSAVECRRYRWEMARPFPHTATNERYGQACHAVCLTTSHACLLTAQNRNSPSCPPVRIRNRGPRSPGSQLLRHPCALCLESVPVKCACRQFACRREPHCPHAAVYPST
eukprot:363634-Chlamydomonas_euryale.AAC.20